ncbi:type II toxin-antitoxin system VapC family toxin [Pyrolobus fumarii]|uniref:type II toxin-antitoxin system VapC family toxin n=1 Tax=Pyrolobus fumarii TaxID=54252 RepID=UPI001FCBF6BA|nr:PIN domain-containing protein [Pyrolobus fumarii]
MLVDSSVIIAALNKSDSLHRRAVRLLSDILRGAYGIPHVTDYIIDEVLTYMAMRGGREAALKAGALFFEKKAFRIIPVTIDMFNEAWSLFARHTPRISFTDATSIVAAKVYNLSYIATFDEELASLYPALR